MKMRAFYTWFALTPRNITRSIYIYITWFFLIRILHEFWWLYISATAFWWHYCSGLLRCCSSCSTGRHSGLWCSSCRFDWFANAEACQNVWQACWEGLSFFVQSVETAHAFGTWLLENRDRPPYSLHQCPKLVTNAGRSQLHKYYCWASSSRCCSGTCHPAGILGEVSWEPCRASNFFEVCCGPREVHPTPLSRRWRPLEEEAAVFSGQRAFGPWAGNRAWLEDCHPSPLQKTLVQFCWPLILYEIPSCSNAKGRLLWWAVMGVRSFDFDSGCRPAVCCRRWCHKFPWHQILGMLHWRHRWLAMASESRRINQKLHECTKAQGQRTWCPEWS